MKVQSDQPLRTLRLEVLSLSIMPLLLVMWSVFKLQYIKNFNDVANSQLSIRSWPGLIRESADFNVQ